MDLYKKVAFLLCWLYVGNIQATAYIEISGYPWDAPGGSYTSNTQAMDLAFGSGNWDEYSETDGATPFLANAQHDFIFIEGGAGAAETLKSYLLTYTNEITSFVDNGGTLFINAAILGNDFPNTPFIERHIETGFGDIQLTPLGGTNGYAGVVDSSYEIFTDYDSPVLPGIVNSNRYEGDEFAHGQITGTGLNYILEGASNSGVLNGEVVLAEIKTGTKQVCVLFGTMTPYIDTQPQGTNLQTSILKYARDCSNLTPPTPPIAEARAIPSLNWPAIATLFFALFGIAGRYSYRSKQHRKQ